MSSSRTHSRDTTQQSSKHHNSRIPTKGSAENGQQNKSTQHISKLARRTVKDVGQVPIRSAGRTPTPVSMAAQKHGPDMPRFLTPVGTIAPGQVGMRTPSLISGSSASTFDSPRSNLLRRKQSGAIDHYAAQKRSEAGTLQLVIPSPQEEEDEQLISRPESDESVFGMMPPQTTLRGSAGSTTPATYENLKYRNLTRDPAVYGYTPSVTPSTRYTDSPFSHVPTPSSASSYSSGLAAVASGARPRRSSSSSRTGTQIGATGRTDEQKQSALHPVRESSTSSSNSTVRTLKEANASRQQRAASTPATPAKATVASPASGTSRATGRRKLTKEPSPSKTRKKPVEVPPELAHLNVATPVSKTPTRPRRDDVAFLADLRTPAPVIQSDLPRLYTGYHKRTSSQESASLESASSVKSRFGLPPRSSSRGTSPRVDSAISPLHPALRPQQQDSAASSSQGLETKNGFRGQRKDSPAVGTAPSPAKSPRFGFFSRKPKTDNKAAEKPRRLSSKGPVAGTGHEGYGRFGFRGRSASTTSSTTSRSPSSDSGTYTASLGSTTLRSSKNSRNSKDSPEMDEFLRDRLKPVYIRGSGSAWSQTESIPDAQGGSTRAPSSQSSVSDGASLPSLLPSAMSNSSRPSFEHRPSFGRCNTQESSDDGFDARITNRRMNAFGAPRSIAPLSAAGASLQVNADSQARQHSFESEGEQRVWLLDNREMPTSPPHAANDYVEGEARGASVARTKSRRLRNFFQRANVPPRSTNQPKGAPSHTTIKNTTPVPVAHYALMDSVSPVGLAEVEDLVSDLETARDKAMHVSYSSAEEDTREQYETYPQGPMEHIAPRQMPSPRSKSATSQANNQPVIFMEGGSRQPHGAELAPPTHLGMVAGPLHTPEQDYDVPKQPRILPFGRIPAVVSTRGRKPSDVSFSRPFAESHPKPPGSVYSQIRGMAASPVEPDVHSDAGKSPWAQAIVTSPLDESNESAIWSSADQAKAISARQSEFITFSERKDSQQSYVSGSSGTRSDPVYLTATNAELPQQEDIWNEYDDLMDAVALDKLPSAAFSLGRSYAQADADVAATVMPHLHPPPSSNPPRVELPAIPGSYINSTVLTVPQQVSRFLQPSMSPLTPDTLSAWVNEYGNRSTCTSFDRMSMLDIPTANMPMQRNSRHSAVSSRQSTGSRHSRSTSLPDATQYGAEGGNRPLRTQNIAHQGRAVVVSQSIRQADNMRAGAFMTSKWLSFGRILFSPANNELRFASEARVLVIDGLSSDWSYYIARSYPNTEVYDMSAGSKVSTDLGWDDADASTPANFRRIPVTSLSAAFPFPKGFFNAIVLRFPTATTEHSYSACVSECKRVLRPGGYLEVAVLDLDLMNMGSQTRKAVKGLKTRMQIRDPTVCLGNLSDVLVRMVGRKGFENVQRCVVGVPAAGRVRSQDLSGSGSDSSERTLWQRNHTSSAHDGSGFLDLLNNTEEKIPDLGNNADESITKMVARVGRWWYTNCYERALLPTDQSIWSERGLLRECEKQRTSFRLLICQAQKPLQTRRRTVSV
ncbi:hypothetical protein CB0940_01126 [Cercospora beticola]|uniref:Uncharacterized protein n=1 Tax=Cercospora beticola TaxID=122368 RepID=A0A2G5I6V8_CERBT|nr:hypothetical protein CB0940_01126 [Cercospora beticola]PIB00462.1 hypothetical protein CB0940_01126 [Cercospora beticola]WPA96554.1 hypothetical protein RHO25_001161 [Cercospora beticola]